MIAGLDSCHSELLLQAGASVCSRIGFCGAIGSIFIFPNDFAVFGAPIRAEQRKYRLGNRLRH